MADAATQQAAQQAAKQDTNCRLTKPSWTCQSSFVMPRIL